MAAATCARSIYAQAGRRAPTLCPFDTGPMGMAARQQDHHLRAVEQTVRLSGVGPRVVPPPVSEAGLLAWAWNINTLKRFHTLPRMSELEMLVDEETPHILGLLESKLNPKERTIIDSSWAFLFPDYALLHEPGNTVGRGGVAVMIHHSILGRVQDAFAVRFEGGSDVGRVATIDIMIDSSAAPPAGSVRTQNLRRLMFMYAPTWSPAMQEVGTSEGLDAKVTFGRSLEVGLEDLSAAVKNGVAQIAPLLASDHSSSRGLMLPATPGQGCAAVAAADTVILGDINVVLDARDMWCDEGFAAEFPSTSAVERIKWNLMLRKFGMRDALRARPPGRTEPAGAYSWWDTRFDEAFRPMRGGNKGLRVDYVLPGPGFNVAEAGLRGALADKGDHCPVGARLFAASAADVADDG